MEFLLQMAGKIREENGLESSVVILEDGGEKSMSEDEESVFDTFLPLNAKNVSTNNYNSNNN